MYQIHIQQNDFHCRVSVLAAHLITCLHVAIFCSLLSPSTFEGAHGNLVRLLERGRRRFHELNDQPTQKGLSVEQQVYAVLTHCVLNGILWLDLVASADRKYTTNMFSGTCL